MLDVVPEGTVVVVVDAVTVVVVLDVVVVVAVGTVVVDVVVDVVVVDGGVVDGVVVVVPGTVVVVGSGDGSGSGAPVNRWRTASAMNAARCSVATRRRCTESTYDPMSAAAGESAQSARWQRGCASHHRRSAAE